MLAAQFQLGVDTFGDVTVAGNGTRHSQAKVLRQVVDEAVLAEQVGVDAFGVGEHHRPDFAISAPEVVLAAIGARTGRILLGSAVTVLSTDDPVRVFQRFSTLNAISNGRAEVILGRGSFTESYPLFGYDLSRYEELFEDKLRLFVELLKAGPVTWSGRRGRRSSTSRCIRRSRAGTLRTWVGVGGSPESVVRAARYGLPLTLAIIGGSPQRFLPFVRSVPPVRSNSSGKPDCSRSPCTRPATSRRPTIRRRSELWPHYEAMMNRIGGERGWPPDEPRAVRSRGRTRRRAVRRIAGDGRRQDREDRQAARACRAST